MKLALITEDGVVITLIEDIEEYDLSKPFARAEVIDEIQAELKKQSISSGKDSRLTPSDWRDQD
jgi:hypothetical protein